MSENPALIAQSKAKPAQTAKQLSPEIAEELGLLSGLAQKPLPLHGSSQK